MSGADLDRAVDVARIASSRALVFRHFLRYLPPFVVAVVFFVLPNVWLGDRVSLGGDDSRLYSVYPYQWLIHVALPAFGSPSLNGFPNFSTQQYYLAFTVLFGMLHHLSPGMNLQALSYGLSLSSGFIGVYWTVLLLTDQWDGATRRYAAMVAGISYATCPLVAVYYWTSPYAWVIGVGGAPLLVSFLICYIRTGNLWNIVAYSILSTIFAVGLQAIPVSLAFVLSFVSSALVFLLWYVRDGSSRLRYLGRSTVVLMSTVFSHAFWLLPLGISLAIPGGLGNETLAAAGSAANVVRDGARGQSILYTLLLLPSPGFMKVWNWPQLAMWQTWFRYILLPSAILPIIILVGVFLVGSVRRLRFFWICIFAATVVLGFVQTVNITSVGVRLFSSFVTLIPGMSMFRDFFNKATGAYVFLYAIVLAIGVCALIGTARRFWRWSAGVVVLIVVLAQSVPMLRGTPMLLPVSGSSFADVDSLSSAYLDAMAYLASRPGFGRVLELPLGTELFGSTFPLAGSNAVYRGVSPVLVLSGRETMNAVGSFAIAGEGGLDQRFAQAVRGSDVNALREVLQLSGVAYILYSAAEPKDALQWLERPEFPRNASAMTALANWLGAAEVAHFGSGMTMTEVFALPASWVLPMLYIEGDEQVKAEMASLGGSGGDTAFPRVSGVVARHPDMSVVRNVERPSSWEYRMQLDLTAPSMVFLSEPYVSGWVASVRSSTSPKGRDLVKVRANGYASGWEISDPGKVTVDLSYRPQRITWIGLATTGSFILLLAGCSAVVTTRRIRRRSSTRRRTASPAGR